jgi:hypothetical protein
MKGRTVMQSRRKLLVAGVLSATLLSLGGVFVSGSASAGPQVEPVQTLAEAVAQPHGIAAGDKVLREARVRPRIAKPGKEGKAVNNGSHKQATKVPMDDLKSRNEEKVKADKQLGKSSRTGGCEPGYGDGKSCLPISSPTETRLNAAMPDMLHEVPWTCAEVRQVFPNGITLQNKQNDPQKLDRNGDGTGCGRGD